MEKNICMFFVFSPFSAYFLHYIIYSGIGSACFHVFLPTFPVCLTPEALSQSNHLTSSTHSSQGWLLSKELAVLSVEWRVKQGVQVDTSIGDGLQGGRALVWEPQTHEESRLPQ